MQNSGDTPGPSGAAGCQAEATLSTQITPCSQEASSNNGKSQDLHWAPDPSARLSQLETASKDNQLMVQGLSEVLEKYNSKCEDAWKDSRHVQEALRAEHQQHLKHFEELVSTDKALLVENATLREDLSKLRQLMESMEIKHQDRFKRLQDTLWQLSDAQAMQVARENEIAQLKDMNTRLELRQHDIVAELKVHVEEHKDRATFVEVEYTRVKKALQESRTELHHVSGELEEQKRRTSQVVRMQDSAVKMACDERMKLVKVRDLVDSLVVGRENPDNTSVPEWDSARPEPLSHDDTENAKVELPDGGVIGRITLQSRRSDSVLSSRADVSASESCSTPISTVSTDDLEIIY